MKYLLIIITFSFFVELKATQQEPDILIYENKSIDIYTYPLEEVWKEVLEDTSYIMNTCFSTSCYRLYQSTWEIIDDKLYLKKISDCCNPELTANLDLIFGKKVNKNIVFSEWFSGRIVIPRGNVIYYEYYSGREVYEYETIVYFKHGIVERTDEVSNKKSTLKYYKQKSLSQYVLSKLSEKIRTEIWENEFKLNFYIKVNCDENQKVIGIEYNTIYEIKYQEEIEAIIMAIEDWDILYQHGERITDTGSYNVRINKKFMKKNKKYWRR